LTRQVTWEHEAVEDLFEVFVRDARLARRLMIAVRSYRMGERIDYKKLQDRGSTWRIRVGDWRILLAVEG
jgi:mRNA-degrading endonuclease RelE of RelBE toxin-antitoxin system